MEIWLGVMVGAGVVLALLFIVGRRATAPGVDPTQLSFDPAVMEQVRALAASGQKVQAIKLLREQTPGLALVTAKLIVDRLEVSANRPRPTSGPGAGPDAAASEPIVPVDNAPSASMVPLDVELEARNLKAQGQPTAAVEVVRASTGFGLREAEDYIDGL